MNLNDFRITCYENEVPASVAAEMDHLYGNIFSSYFNLDIPEAVRRKVSAYTVHNGGTLAVALLFTKEGDRVRVLNEVIRISREDISLFSHYIFTSYRDVNIISFKAIETDVARIGFPLQRFNYSEDIWMTLPRTPQEYHSSLGKNTRRNIKRYSEKLKRAFPSFQFKTYDAKDITEQQIYEIVALNRERMALKNKISVIDEKETRQIIKRAQSCGLVGIATINGTICAGAISYRVGDNYFLDVLSHDPDYNDYWIGILCCYMTICECIERGGKEFHFLWGRYEYKFTLGASIRNLDSVHVYRSRLQYLLNAAVAMKVALDGYTRAAKLFLHNNHVMSRLAQKVTNLVNHKSTP